MSLTLSWNEGGGRDHFSYDVLFPIFLYVPANTLVKFRYACKYWFNLITSNIRDPRFVELHTHIHDPHNNPTTTIHNLPTILCIPTPRANLYSFNTNNINKEAPAPAIIEIGYPFKSHSSKLEIMCSYNGLLFIKVTDYKVNTSKVNYPKDIHCLWNPCTNEFKHVSASTYDAGIIYGIGYDRLINDYKLVRFARSYYGFNKYVHVYTMGTDSWKWIGEHVPSVPKISQVMGLFVNGAFHWISSTDNRIDSFDIEDEEFRVVPIPEWSETMMWKLELQVLRGCLCMFNGYYDQCTNGRLEVWMMMDYGVKESWTKLFRAIVPKYMPWGHMNPLWIWKNGQVLIQSGIDQFLVIYDPNNKKFDSGYLGRPSRWISTIVNTGSLVSLKSGTYVGQEQQPKQEKKKNTELQGTDGGGTYYDYISHF